MASKKSINRTKRRKLWTKIGIAAAVIAVIALIVVSFFTSTTYYRQKTALEIADHDISVAEYNYYYGNVYQNTYTSLQETYGEYVDIVLDPSLPLDEQAYSEDQTWAEYLRELTISNLEEIYAFYDAAVAADYTLSEASQVENEEILASVRSAAAGSGYSVDNYLGAVYGKGVNEKVYTNLINTVSLALDYSDEVLAGFQFTDDERAAFYAENQTEIDSVTARIYPIAYVAEDSETEGLSYEEAKANAEGALDVVKTEEDFIDYVVSLNPESPELYEDGASTLYNGLTYSAFNSTELSDWLFDDARAEGNLTVIEGESEFYIAMFISRSDNDYNLVSMRHILIAPEKDEDGNLVEGAEEAALAQLETINEDWQANGATEEYFAILANTYSADGDGTTGGLYEDVYQGQMVPGIDSWLFDDARTAGNSEIIESEYGWHLVYFVGEGENYKTVRIDEGLRAAHYDEWHASVLEGHEAVIDESGMELAH